MGCGWLGQPLAMRLTKKGYRIKGSTTSEHKLQTLREYGITPYLVTLETIDSKIAAFLESDILIVNIPSKNIEGFKHFAKYAEGSPIRKVIFISSTSVYSFSNQLVTEETPTNDSPLTEIEQLFSTSMLFQTTIIRFAGLFGYNRKPGNWFSNGKKIPNPDGFVNMIHQDDCIGIIEQIIENDIWNNVINGCATTHPTRREFYSKAKYMIGAAPPQFEETETSKYKIISNEKIVKMEYEFKYPDVLLAI